jgi:chromosome condensin MukBEF MukE localization factor
MNIKLTDDQLDKEVLFQLKLHQGAAHPLGRWEMVVKIFGTGADFPQDDSNVYDRQVRESVARLRKSGMLICDMGDSRGRFLATSAQEYQAFRRYYGAQAFEKLETIREMDRAADEQFPNRLQPALFPIPEARKL